MSLITAEQVNAIPTGSALSLLSDRLKTAIRNYLANTYPLDQAVTTQVVDDALNAIEQENAALINSIIEGNIVNISGIGEVIPDKTDQIAASLAELVKNYLQNNLQSVTKTYLKTKYTEVLAAIQSIQ